MLNKLLGLLKFLKSEEEKKIKIKGSYFFREQENNHMAGMTFSTFTCLIILFNFLFHDIINLLIYIYLIYY